MKARLKYDKAGAHWKLSVPLKNGDYIKLYSLTLERAFDGLAQIIKVWGILQAPQPTHDRWEDIDWARTDPYAELAPLSYNVVQCSCDTPWRHYP